MTTDRNPLTTDREILPIPRQQFDVGLPDVEAQLDRDTGLRRTRQVSANVNHCACNIPDGLIEAVNHVFFLGHGDGRLS